MPLKKTATLLQDSLVLDSLKSEIKVFLFVAEFGSITEVCIFKDQKKYRRLYFLIQENPRPGPALTGSGRRLPAHRFFYREQKVQLQHHEGGIWVNYRSLYFTKTKNNYRRLYLLIQDREEARAQSCHA